MDWRINNIRNVFFVLPSIYYVLRQHVTRIWAQHERQHYIKELNESILGFSVA